MAVSNEWHQAPHGIRPAGPQPSCSVAFPYWVGGATPCWRETHNWYWPTPHGVARVEVWDLTEAALRSSGR